MTAPWVRMPTSVLDVLIGMAEDIDGPWPVEAAIADLIRRQDLALHPFTPTKMISYREAAARWGWGEKRARLLIAAEDRWADPSKAVAWAVLRAGRSEGAAGAQEGRTEGAARTDEARESDKEGRSEGAAGAREGRSEGDTGVGSTTTTTTTTTVETETQGRPEQPEPSTPAWASGERLPTGVTRSALVAAVVACIAAVKAKPVNPDRCGTDAAQVLALWRKLERPPLDEFVADFTTVAKAAHHCPDPLFARDIRAVGWQGAKNREFDVTTIAVQARWSTRLDTAQQWQAKQRPAERKATQAVQVERQSIETSPELVGAWRGMIAALDYSDCGMSWIEACGLQALGEYVLIRAPSAYHIETIRMWWEQAITDHFDGRRVVFVEERRDQGSNVVQLRSQA